MLLLTLLGAGFVFLPLGLGLGRRSEELPDTQQQLQSNATVREEDGEENRAGLSVDSRQTVLSSSGRPGRG